LSLFIDTWGWLAMADAGEPLHKPTAACYREHVRSGQRVITSNFILDETITILFKRLPFSQAVRFSEGVLRSHTITVEPVTEKRFQAAFELRKRLQDKPTVSFTDLSSMVILTELKIPAILTQDQHFAQVGLDVHILPA
jgi:uncharacterized protein